MERCVMSVQRGMCDMECGLLHSRSYRKNRVHSPFMAVDAPPYVSLIQCHRIQR